VAAGELPLPPTSIATGGSETLRAPVDPDLPEGRWTADVRVVGNGLSDEASATLVLGQHPPETDGEGRGAVIALASLLLLLAVIALLLARRRKDDEEDEGGADGSGGSPVEAGRVAEPVAG
jgi:hypothetical protein